MNRNTKFIIFIVAVVVIVGGIGAFFTIKDNKASSKLDGLAQALKAEGAEFYGAFWCPHCQEQKEEFGSSKKYLPYIECSTPDNKQEQVCIDEKIEGYPSWKFKNGISVESNSEPFICEIKTDTTVEPAICENRSSKYFRTWLFADNNLSIKSPTDPIKEGNIYKFEPEAEASGKLPIPFLAKQINFTLPQ